MIGGARSWGRWRAALAAIGALAVSRGGVARADGSDLESLLDERVVTTASKSAEVGSNAPATSTTLTSEDIRRYGLHSIDEAIDFLSLGAVTSKTMNGAEIGARGVTISGDQGDHFLLLVNGHAVNEAFFGAARFDRGAGIPIEMVDRIEVILGPGSVLYGSNAMLGVINVVTKPARDFHGTHAIVEAEVGKSWRVAAGAGYEFPLAGAPVAVTAEFEYYKQDGPSVDVPQQNVGADPVAQTPIRTSRNGPPTGIWGGELSKSVYSRIPAGVLQLKWNNFELNLHASIFKRGAPSYPRDLEPYADFDDPLNYEQDRSVWADIRHHAVLSRVAELTSRLYGDVFDYARYADISERYRCLYSAETCRKATLAGSRWAGLEEQLTLDWFHSGRFVTLLGVDGRIREVLGKTDLSDYDTGAPLASSTGVLHTHDFLVGPFVQQTWQPIDPVALNVGGRMDVYDRFGSRFSPRAAASASPWQGGTVKVVYSEAFRAPSWGEAASASPQDDQILAGQLTPETVRSLEVSFEEKFGRQRLLWGAFRSQWNNMIELATISPAQLTAAIRQGLLPITTTTASQFQNLSSIESYGFNLSYEGHLTSRLAYGANVTAAVARRQDAGGQTTPVTVAPRLFGNARISYALPSPWPTLALAAHYMGSRAADRAYDSGWSPPPYAPSLLDLRGTVSGPVPGIPGLSYRASVDYATASLGPYAIGFAQTGYQALTPQIELNPIDTFRATVGVEYEF